MLKIGANTFIWESPFRNESFGLVDRIAGLGFDVVEIGIEEPDQIDATELRRRLDGAGVTATACAFLTPSQDVSSAEAAIRDRGLEHIARCIDIAVTLGAPFLNGPLYCAVGATGFRSPDDRAAQRRRAADAVGEAAERAAAAGIGIGLEPLNRYETDVLNTVEQSMAFLDLIGRTDVGLMLDTYHMNIEERDIPAAIRRAGDRVFEFQASGNDRGAPAPGIIDWSGIRAALADVSYAGPAVIEAFNPGNERMAKTFPLWRRLAADQDELASNGLGFLKAALAPSSEA